MIDIDIRKNLLDLEYQKYLQYHIATVIILFTYFIGVGIALLTKQIRTDDYNQFIILILLSSLVIGISVLSLHSFSINLRRINEEIKRLV